MDDLKINEWLKERYGTTPEGKPIWRVVWSTNLTEKRFGEFHEHAGQIYLRTVKGVQTVLKYPFDQDRWILEHLVELREGTQVSKELVENKFSYEPLYVFKSKNGSFLPLNRDVIEIFIYFWLKRQDVDPTTRRIQLTEEYYKREEEEREHIKQLIGENMSVPHLMDLVW